MEKAPSIEMIIFNDITTPMRMHIHAKIREMFIPESEGTLDRHSQWCKVFGRTPVTAGWEGKITEIANGKKCFRDRSVYIVCLWLRNGHKKPSFFKAYLMYGLLFSLSSARKLY
jgi:hypothetical protein